MGNNSTNENMIDFSFLEDYISDVVEQALKEEGQTPESSNKSEIKKYIQDILTQSLRYNKEKSIEKSQIQEHVQDTLNKSLKKMNKLFETSNAIHKETNEKENNYFTSPSFDNSIISKLDSISFNLKIPEKIDKKNIKVSLRKNEVVVKWNPDQEKQIVKIPPIMNPENVKAIVKKHILELRFILNSSANSKEEEIDIQYV
ncbi:hypothetical protein [Sporohalobacter salinus]|uniref:hypothetical protein n=1 Tax=Sporohalobacter salinus TaxID=1494606 RepID=UPI00195FDA8D|nr:hypothetical protein [Sporohalobacter salinus]MBM7624451.1 HSP20 family molecular chaperone IbpA [Sporohalobacter salinus]